MFAFRQNFIRKNVQSVVLGVYGLVEMLESDDADDDYDDGQGFGMIDHFLFIEFVTTLIIVNFCSTAMSTGAHQ